MQRQNLTTHPDLYIARFWSKVQRCAHVQRCTRCCWPWQGGIKNNGYGEFFIGRYGDKVKMVHTHIFAWELAHGPLLLSVDVLHRCDNKPCVNDAHLYLGTQLDNARDAVERNRLQTGAQHYYHRLPGLIRRGEAIGNHKLTTADVQQAYTWRLAGGTYGEIAKKLSVSECLIGEILRGEKWQHLFPSELAEAFTLQDGRKRPRQST